MLRGDKISQRCIGDAGCNRLCRASHKDAACGEVCSEVYLRVDRTPADFGCSSGAVAASALKSAAGSMPAASTMA